MSSVRSIQNFQSVPFNRIDANYSENLRKTYEGIESLAQSILTQGQIDPIGAYKEGDKYIVVYGYRRYTAIQSLIKNGDLPTDFAVKIQKIEKPNRENHILLNINTNSGMAFSAIELANAFKELSECGYTQAVIAEKTGYSQPEVSNYLKLLTMPDDVQEAVQSGGIAFNTAIAAHRSGKMDELVNIVNQPSVEIIEGGDGEPTTVKVSKKATIKEFTKADTKGENVNPVKLIKSVIGQIEKGNYPKHDKEALQALKDIVEGIGTEDDVLTLLGV